MALIDDLKTRFPDIPTGTIDTYYAALSFSNAEFWKCYFCFDYIQGDCNSEAILNLVAHLIMTESSGSDSAIKDVSSVSVGSVSESYFEGSSVNSSQKDFFNTTKYGQKFLLLISTSGGAVFA